ncbi:MAG: hypothetical protein AAF737_08290 [Pseudomonadota bacterium]
MPDYHAVLNKTLAGLPTNTPEIRSKVYDKARATIRRQLDAVQPALPVERIEAEVLNLETAIADVEAAQAPPPAPPSDTDILDDLEAELGLEAAAEPYPAAQPEPSFLAASSAPAATAPEPAAPMVPGPPAVQPTVEATPGAFPAASQKPPVAPPQPTGPSAPMVDRAASNSFDEDEPKKRSRKGLIAFLVLLLALLGGAFAASQNPGGLNGLAQQLVPGVEIPFLGIGPSTEVDGATTPSTPVDAEPEVQAESTETGDGETKFGERLGTDGNTTSAEPELQPVEQPATDADDADLVPADPSDPSVEGPGEGAPSLESDDDVPEPGDVVVDENGVQFTVPAAPADEAAGQQQSEAEPAAPAAAGATVAQRAFFYVENNGNEGTTRTPGSVIWTNGEREGLPTIEGDVSVDELGIGMKMVIRKNVDETLSASHVIDILFDLPDDFTGNGIEAVRQVVFKPTEEEQGNALIAEPARISDTFFIVALYDLPEAEAANAQIMRERPWIDLPIAYTTGRRALLTIEKGARGTDVFRRAFDAWALDG